MQAAPLSSQLAKKTIRSEKDKFAVMPSGEVSPHVHTISQQKSESMQATVLPTGIAPAQEAGIEEAESPFIRLALVGKERRRRTRRRRRSLASAGWQVLTKCGPHVSAEFWNSISWLDDCGGLWEVLCGECRACVHHTLGYKYTRGGACDKLRIKGICLDPRRRLCTDTSAECQLQRDCFAEVYPTCSNSLECIEGHLLYRDWKNNKIPVCEEWKKTQKLYKLAKCIEDHQDVLYELFGAVGANPPDMLLAEPDANSSLQEHLERRIDNRRHEVSSNLDLDASLQGKCSSR